LSDGVAGGSDRQPDPLKVLRIHRSKQPDLFCAAGKKAKAPQKEVEFLQRYIAPERARSRFVEPSVGGPFGGNSPGRTFGFEPIASRPCGYRCSRFFG
jgi:hypothetical protein